MSAAVDCAATNPQQYVTLYADGRVRIHVKNLDTGGQLPYRTMAYRPRSKSDRAAIRRLIHHLNLTAGGYEGGECTVCGCL